MVVLESIFSHKMCMVTSRDDSANIQCFLFTLVFAPCIILALKYDKVLFQTGKISGIAFHGDQILPKIFKLLHTDSKSPSVLQQTTFVPHVFVFCSEQNINFCCCYGP